MCDNECCNYLEVEMISLSRNGEEWFTDRGLNLALKNDSDIILVGHGSLTSVWINWTWWSQAREEGYVIGINGK